MKGERGDQCARGVCQKPNAQWFNQSTRKWYCRGCARAINRANRTDAQRLYGGPLCIRWQESCTICTRVIEDHVSAFVVDGGGFAHFICHNERERAREAV